VRTGILNTVFMPDELGHCLAGSERERQLELVWHLVGDSLSDAALLLRAGTPAGLPSLHPSLPGLECLCTALLPRPDFPALSPSYPATFYRRSALTEHHSREMGEQSKKGLVQNGRDPSILGFDQNRFKTFMDEASLISHKLDIGLPIHEAECRIARACISIR